MSALAPSSLVDALVGVAQQLDPSIDQPALCEQITRLIGTTDIAADGVPDWLVRSLQDLRERRSGGWRSIPLEGDRSGPMALLRGLPAVVPSELDDMVEGLTLVFHRLDLQLDVSWEGSCFRIAPIGSSWD